MLICSNLDEFYDVIFHVGSSYIKGNTSVLKARSQYFEAMLSVRHGYLESSGPIYYDKGRDSSFRVIKVEGVPKEFFNCIIQYLYSDHFYIGQQSVEFFIQLLIYADYFMVPRIGQICSKYIRQFICLGNVLSVLLVAHAHNAADLELFCIDFICLHEQEIVNSQDW